VLTDLSGLVGDLARMKGVVLLDCFVSLTVSSMAFLPSLLVRYLIDVAIPERHVGAIVSVSLSMVLCPVLVRVLSMVTVWSRMRLDHEISLGLQSRVLYAYLTAPVDEALRLSSGQVLTVVNSDVPALVGGLLSAIREVCASVYSLILAGFLLWRTSPVICMGVLLASIVRYPLVSARVQVLRQMTASGQAWQAGLNRVIADAANAVITTKVHFLEQRTVDLFRSFASERHRERRGFQHKLDRYSVAETSLGWLVPAAVYAYGGLLIIAGRTTIGALVAATQYMGRGVESLSTLLDLSTKVRVLVVHHDHVRRILSLSGETEDDGVKGSDELLTIEIRHGTYGYPGQASPVLRYVDVSLATGRIVGLYGPSGSGKTTLATILGGLRRLTSGTFLVNGSEGFQPGRSYRRTVALVTEGEYVFSGTFKDNLIAAKPEALDEELSRALFLSLLDEVVDEAPLGLQTLIGQGGMTLSTGQRQRLSLARAILRDPDLIILDEITSGLDQELEKRMIERLEGWLRDRMVLLISHRPSTLRLADTWVYLDEEGRTHAASCLSIRDVEDSSLVETLNRPAEMS
jgi:ABC-type bacteriocin/lantibiotic exporter with double-glycine peptidase domain